MPTLRRLAVLIALGAAIAVPATAAQAASIWSPVASGTTDTISAIAYQSPTRFWYATTNGRIAYWDGSAFQAASGPTVGELFTDIAFQPTGTGGPGTAGVVGYAVTSTGHVWRSTDGGVHWTQLAALSTESDCSSSPTTATVTELNAVVWSNNQTVYLLGNNSTVEKSTSADAGSPSFAEINKVGTGTCAVQSNGYDTNFTDGVFQAANPLNGFLISQSFGHLFQTTNAFASGVSIKDTVNSYQGNPRLAIDQANPNRLWAVDHDTGGGGCGTLCLIHSSDAGQTSGHPTFVFNGSPTVGLYDVTSQGGVEVAAGTAGEIWTSNDGTNFWLQKADGTLGTENWRAEDAYDAQHAAVGGVGGALAVTAQANTLPTPTATISGPSSVAAGTDATYTATLNDPANSVDPYSYGWSAAGLAGYTDTHATFNFAAGTTSARVTFRFKDLAGNPYSASFPVTVKNPTPPPHPTPPVVTSPRTQSTGGGTVTAFKKVTVTGHARYIPVKLSSTAGRTFVLTLLTVKGHHRVVPAVKATLKRGGRKTVNIVLGSKVKTGNYLLVVRVVTLKGKGVGRQITFAFRLV